MSSVAGIAVSSVMPAGRNGPSSGFRPRHVSVYVAANYGKITSASKIAAKQQEVEHERLNPQGFIHCYFDWSYDLAHVHSSECFFGAPTAKAVAIANVRGVKVGALFECTCSGCHTGGGNFLQPSTTLFNKDLDRNGLNSVDVIYNITYIGKNRMPGYGEKCTSRGQCTFGSRLGEDHIRPLAEFVKSQADKGWIKAG